MNEKRLPPDGRLPPILPVVLYNGDPRWAAPLALRDLVGLPGDSPLWRWQPAMRYHLMDEGASREDDLAGVTRCWRCCSGWKARPTRRRLLFWRTRCWRGSGAIRGLRRLRAVFVELLGAHDGAAGAGGSGAGGVVGGKEHAGDTGREPGSSSGCRRARQQGASRRAVRRVRRRAAAPAGAPVRCAAGLGADRIAAADSAALEEWGLRVLDAGSLDDVLA